MKVVAELLLLLLWAVLLLFLAYVVFLAVCSLFVDPKKEYETNSRFYRFLLNSATAGAMKLLRIRIHVTGLEKVPAGERVLFVGNHRSNFDPIIEWYVFKKWEPAFISKAGNFKVPFFGRFIRRCCFMAIDRENPRRAVVTINKAAELMRRGEVSVGVYPEGTRCKTGGMLPFHNVVFRVAQKAEAPIAVLAISGSEQIHKRTPFRRTEVYLDVVDVISTEEAGRMKTDAIGARVRVALEKRLYQESEQESHGKELCSV